MYDIIINKMPKKVPTKFIKPVKRDLPNELQFKVNHEHTKKAILKHKDIFEGPSSKPTPPPLKKKKKY